MDKEYLQNAVGWLDEANRRLFLAVPVSGRPVLDTLVVFHYELEAFSIIRGQEIHAATRWMGETVLGVELVENAKRSYSAGTCDLFLYGLESGSCTASDIVLDPNVYSDSIDPHQDDKEFHIDQERPQPEDLVTIDMTACEPRGLIRFGPYSATETGWSSNDLMEVAGLDVFFRHTGKHSVSVRWYKDRNPVAEGSIDMLLNQDGVLSVMPENTDLVGLEGWEKTWGAPNTWGGTRHLYQRVKFPNTVLCREIEVEFFNAETHEPFEIDAFVLWRVSKGQEAQR